MTKWLTILFSIIACFNASAQQDTDLVLNRTVISYDNHHKLPAADIKYDSIAFTIALFDANNDSIYNSPETDMVIVAPYKADSVYTHIGCQAGLLTYHKNVVVLAGKWEFRVSCAEANTKGTIHIKALGWTNLFPDAQLFDHIPDIFVTTLQGKKVALLDTVKTKKYTYFIFWGSWCKPCEQALEQLKYINQWYKEWVTIVGINFSEPDTVALRKLIKDKGYNWPQFVGTPETVLAFSQSGYPYGVLFAPGGKIVKQGMTVPQLKTFMSKHAHRDLKVYRK